MPSQVLNLSVIIVSFNTARALADCLRSIPSGAAALDYEIIVVDNGSTDTTREMLTRDFPNVRVICNAENIGFARANNQGWRASGGDFVLFLNSDTLVAAHSLARLVEFHASHADAGACAPHLARAHGATQPFAFGGDPSPAYLLRRGVNRLLFRRALHDWETRAATTVDWVSGACMLTRRDALEQVGGFDEKFFLYFEDNDLCLRLRRAGWKILHTPQVTITHIGGASDPQNRARARAYAASLRYFYAKHYSPLARLALELMLPFYRRIQSE